MVMYMRTFSSAGLFVALVSIPFAVFAGSKPLVYGNVSGWTVLTDPDHDYHCFAEARYEGGSFIRVGFNSSDALYMTVGDAAWTDAVAGRDYMLDLKFDDEDSRRFSSTGISDGNGLRLVVPEDQRGSFMKDFMSRYSISIGRSEHEAVTLSLGGSHNATRMLEECQVSMADLRGQKTQ
jgi:hypothetical protein